MTPIAPQKSTSIGFIASSSTTSSIPETWTQDLRRRKSVALYAITDSNQEPANITSAIARVSNVTACTTNVTLCLGMFATYIAIVTPENANATRYIGIATIQVSTRRQK